MIYGLNFPIQLDSQGGIILPTLSESIKSNILVILGWPIGTRTMLGQFGSYMFTMVNQQNTIGNLGIMRTFITEAIRMWEPRITLINADLAYIQNNRMSISLVYMIKDTKTHETYNFEYELV